MYRCNNYDKIRISKIGENIQVRIDQHHEKQKHIFNFKESNIIAFVSKGRKREIKETFLTKKLLHWTLNEIQIYIDIKRFFLL